MYAYAHSMTKVISLSDSAYHEVKSLKHPEDSFSDIILKLVHKHKKKPILEFFGRWPGTKEEAESIKKIWKKTGRNLKPER